MEPNQLFAARLRELRTRAGLTQQQLADRSGVKLGSIRSLEQGANGPTWDTVVALAKALGVDCTAFLQEPGEEVEPRKPGRPRKQAGAEGQAEEQESEPAQEKPAEKTTRKKRKGKERPRGRWGCRMSSGAANTPVSVLDVWAEYHRLWKEEGWTQQQIAEAKACGQKQVSYRIKWHTSLCRPAKRAVFDGLFDEGHCEAVSDVVFDVEYLSPWLTTEQAQEELVAEVLGKHRGGRHLTPQEQQAARKERIDREKELREQGKSYRDIAAEVGVDVAQVYRDLETNGTVDQSTVPDRVVGRDGRSQPAKRKKSGGRRKKAETNAASTNDSAAEGNTTTNAQHAQGKTTREIAEALGVSHVTIVKDLKALGNSVADATELPSPAAGDPSIDEDQELARLFVECGWTQEKIAAKVGKRPTWVSQALRFGRFLSFIATGDECRQVPENLTERRFRTHWQKTKGSDSEARWIERRGAA